MCPWWDTLQEEPPAQSAELNGRHCGASRARNPLRFNGGSSDEVSSAALGTQIPRDPKWIECVPRFALRQLFVVLLECIIECDEHSEYMTSSIPSLRYNS